MFRDVCFKVATCFNNIFVVADADVNSVRRVIVFVLKSK